MYGTHRIRAKRLAAADPAVSLAGQCLWSERARNWLALGLLLTAWNAVDDGESRSARPGALRGYDIVSVRAVARSAADSR